MSNASLRTALSAVLCASFAFAASAQDVVNPTKVEFQPSVDHFVVSASGDPAVLRYDLQFFASGAPQSMATVSLGKPTPESDGRIRVDFSTLLATWPLADGNYTAKVVSVGGSGNGSSDVSNTFSFVSSTTPPVVTCSYTLSSSTVSVAAAGGSSSLSVAASGATCAWAVANSTSWISVTPGSGTGSGTLAVVVAANTATSARTATFTVGSQAVTVAQAAATPPPCSYALSSTKLSVGRTSSSSSLSVTASGTTCAWTSSNSTSWFSVTPTAATGSKMLTIAVAANTTTTARSASFTVAGQAVTITQAASKSKPPKGVLGVTVSVR